MDMGFPKCPICNNEVTQLRGKNFKQTCSWECSVDYRRTNRVNKGNRSAYIKSIQENYKLGVTTWKIKSETLNSVVCECSNCKKSYSRSPKYFITNGCRCQCGKKISQSSRMSDEEFSAILKPKKIKLLSKYENMNKKVLSNVRF